MNQWLEIDKEVQPTTGIIVRKVTPEEAVKYESQPTGEQPDSLEAAADFLEQAEQKDKGGVFDCDPESDDDLNNRCRECFSRFSDCYCEPEPEGHYEGEVV
jgi:hypothetical protein